MNRLALRALATLAFATTTPGVAAAGHAPPEDMRTIPIRVELAHQYGYGENANGERVPWGKHRVLGQTKGLLKKYNDGSRMGSLRLHDLDFFLPLDVVENIKYESCGVFACKMRDAVRINLHGHHVRRLMSALLQQFQGDTPRDVFEDASWIISRCFDDPKRTDHCTTDTAKYSAPWSAMHNETGVDVVFHGHPTKERRFRDFVEITNYSREQLGPPRSERSFSSLTLLIRLDDSDWE